MSTRPRKLQQRQRGFTLTEVAVALGILVLALVAILAGFAASARLSNRLHQNTTVLNLARSQLELGPSQPYSNTKTYTTFCSVPES